MTTASLSETIMPAPVALPHRDNLFGVCHAIGRAFGFNPLYLRLMFMLAMLMNFPLAALGYALSGVAVLASVAVDRLGDLASRRAALAR